MQKTLGAPRRFVGQAEVTNLACLDQITQYRQGFFDFDGLIIRVVGVTEHAEEVGLAIRPVQLVQVRVIGVQTLEAGFQRRSDVFAVEARIAIADVIHPTGPATLLASTQSLRSPYFF